MADTLKAASVDHLAAIVWPAAEAWFNNRELLALQEILDRPEAGPAMPAVTALDAKALALAELMTNGSEFAENVDGKAIIAPDWPLTLKEAALVCNMKLRDARALADSPLFVEQLNKLLKQRRASERARNLSTAVEIRDTPGEGLAADRTVRLKAVSVIEGVENKGVVVNVNQTTNSLTVQPGYIIRLPAKRDAPLDAIAQRTPVTIDATREEILDD
jgi:hypothetical protein